MFFRILIAAVLLAIAGTSAAAQDRPADVHLNRGYEHLRAGRPDSATAAFRRAVAAEPRRRQPREELAYALLGARRLQDALPQLDTLVQRAPDDVRLRTQLGYTHASLGQNADALDHFVVVTRLSPEDGRAWLQRGYLHARMNDRDEARSAYRQAERLGPADVAESAGKELAALDAGTLAPGTLFLDTYAAPFYQDRFDNFVLDGIARLGYVLPSAPRVQIYGSLRVTADSRSSQGAVPQIYAENAIIPALGARIGTGPVSLFGEVGAAIPTLEGVRPRDARLDVRGGAFVAPAWAPAASDGTGRAGELYADVVYYSRHNDNVIASVIYRDGIRVLANRHLAIDAYGRAGLVLDTRREFFNNIGELGAGFRIHPRSTGGWLGVEYVRGRYLDEAPRGRTYNDLRLLFVFSRLDILRSAVRL